MGLFTFVARAFERLIAAARDMTTSRNGRLAGDARQHSCGLLANVFTSAPEPIVILSAEGLVCAFNPAAEALFGYDDGAALDFDVARLLSLGGDPASSSVARLRALANNGGHEEIAGWHRDGTVIPIEASGAEMSTDSGPAFVIFLRDLRERSRSDQMKSEFVATVSHELRTPLTSISGSLGLLASGTGGSLPDAALRLIRIAHANSQRLARLVNDLLDIQKIESGAVHFDICSVPLKPLIQQAIEHTRPFAEGFNVTVQLDPDSADGIADADPDRLSQVVTNLLSNAIKFSPDGGEVDVSIALRDEDVRICVRDRGEGIPEDFRDRIFEKFAQADRSDMRHKGGTGLGLSIVQQIMIRMNGDVGFDSPPDGGTVFYVDLPQCRNLSGTGTDGARAGLSVVGGRAA